MIENTSKIEETKIIIEKKLKKSKLTYLLIKQFHNFSRNIREKYDDIEVDLQEVMMEGCLFEKIQNLDKIQYESQGYFNQDFKALMRQTNNNYYFGTMKNYVNQFTKFYFEIEAVKNQVLVILVWDTKQQQSITMIRKFNSIMNSNRSSLMDKVRIIALSNESLQDQK